MSKKTQLKKEILEVMEDATDFLIVETIIEGVQKLRIKKALLELEAEGKVRYNASARGWEIKK